MADAENRLREIIIEKYGSLKKFCETIDMPWTTLDSILKRGIANSNITNVMKITRELNINTELLASGIIKPLNGEELIDYFYDTINKIIELIRQKGYVVIDSGNPQDNTIIIKDKLNNTIKITTEDDLVSIYENVTSNNSERLISELLDINQPTTLAAHFEGEQYTDEEMEEIMQFAEFVKNRKNKDA